MHKFSLLLLLVAPYLVAMHQLPQFAVTSYHASTPPNTAGTQTIHNLHAGKITSLAINQDGSLIACTTDKNTIVVWDVQTTKKIQTIAENDPKATCAAFHAAGGPLLAVGFSDGKMQVFHAQTGALTLEQDAIKTSFNEQPHIRYITMGPTSNNDLVAGACQESIYLWTLDPQKKIITIRVKERVASIALNVHGDLIAAGTDNGCIRVWATHDGSDQALFGDEISNFCTYDPTNLLAFDACDPTLISSSNRDSSTVTVWNVPTTTEETSKLFTVTVPGSINQITSTTNGTLVIAAYTKAFGNTSRIDVSSTRYSADTQQFEPHFACPLTAEKPSDIAGEHLRFSASANGATHAATTGSELALWTTHEHQATAALTEKEIEQAAANLAGADKERQTAILLALLEHIQKN